MGFRDSNVMTPLPRLCYWCSVINTNEVHYVIHWEVRESLYAYTMCIHINLRTCEKVGEFWSTSVLTLKLANHSSH